MRKTSPRRTLRLFSLHLKSSHRSTGIWKREFARHRPGRLNWQESLENRAPRPQPLTVRKAKTPSAAKKKRLVQKKAGATLSEGVSEKRQTVVDLRLALEKRDAEIGALKKQLRVCKAKMDALRRKLRVCRKANTDLQATQKGLETHSSVVAQLKEAHSTRWNCAHTPTPDFRTPIRCTASGDAESREMSSATASVTSCHPEFAFTPPTTELLQIEGGQIGLVACCSAQWYRRLSMKNGHSGRTGMVPKANVDCP
ncbi:uncharacterized protein LOC128521291 [Clarias gariepinus]|uniref:uncharacterized protein LOC128521291 n=1 Tax=Clarias gariepinus TaxID=13013 RepID=UPI00234C34BF|nr:uncharacterized protein LOC128521291 [Clarias gariepinus]